jgi:hypothetical protein
MVEHVSGNAPDSLSPQTPELAAESRKSGQDLQVLTMNKERIAVPEVLFHPSDIGTLLRRVH